jgi:hypothetical protein
VGANPDASRLTVSTALGVAARTSTARDAGKRGPDPEFGAGVLDPCAAAARIAPERVRCAD